MRITIDEIMKKEKNMYPSSKYAYIFRSGCRQSFVTLATWLLLSGVVAAQYPPAAAAKPDLLLPPPNLMSLRAAFSLVPGVQGNDAAPPAIGLSVQANNGGSYSTPNAGDAPAGVHRITLEQAKQMATGGAIHWYVSGSSRSRSRNSTDWECRQCISRTSARSF